MAMMKVKSEKSHGTTPGAITTRWLAAVCLLFLLAVCPLPAQAAKIQYRFTSWSGPDLTVFVTRPVGLSPDRPVVFVMHGATPVADEDRERWHELAIEFDFLLVAPEIARADLPGAKKDHLGNLFDDQGTLKADSIVSYASIEAVFNDVRSRFNVATNTYSLFGDSEGAEFAQRFVFYVPASRADRVVLANADWYMMPDFDIAFPFGLGQSAIDTGRLEKSLQRPVTVLLGEGETDSDQDKLRQMPEAMAQGPNRLARGQAFFDSARAAADLLGVPFNWSLETVPGAGHDVLLMAPAAIPFLLGEKLTAPAPVQPSTGGISQ